MEKCLHSQFLFVSLQDRPIWRVARSALCYSYMWYCSIEKTGYETYKNTRYEKIYAVYYSGLAVLYGGNVTDY